LKFSNSVRFDLVRSGKLRMVGLHTYAYGTHRNTHKTIRPSVQIDNLVTRNRNSFQKKNVWCSVEPGIKRTYLHVDIKQRIHGNGVGVIRMCAANVRNLRRTLLFGKMRKNVKRKMSLQIMRFQSQVSEFFT
jgi:hypothetical protein